MKEAYDLGLILRDLRIKAKKTQEEVGARINRDKGIVSRYETNVQTPSFEIMRDLARYFNVSMDYLAGFESPSAINTSGLSDAQILLLRDLADLFRAQNGNVGQLSDEQIFMLGRISAAFVKK